MQFSAFARTENQNKTVDNTQQTNMHLKYKLNYVKISKLFK
jgi:hypothetical protein